MSSSDLLFDAIVQGDQTSVDDHVHHLLAEDMPAGDILDERCIPATQEARQRLEQGEFYIPDLSSSPFAPIETLWKHCNPISQRKLINKPSVMVNSTSPAICEARTAKPCA